MPGLCADNAMVLASMLASFSGSTGGVLVGRGWSAGTAGAGGAVAAGAVGAAKAAGAPVAALGAANSEAAGPGGRRPGGLGAASSEGGAAGPGGRGPEASPGGAGSPASWKIMPVLMEPSRRPSTARLHFSTSIGWPTIVTRAFSSEGLCWSTKQCAREKTLIALIVVACLPIRRPTELCGISSCTWFLLPPATTPEEDTVPGAGAGPAIGPAPALEPMPTPPPAPLLALAFPNWLPPRGTGPPRLRKAGIPPPSPGMPPGERLIRFRLGPTVGETFGICCGWNLGNWGTALGSCDGAVLGIFTGSHGGGGGRGLGGASAGEAFACSVSRKPRFSCFRASATSASITSPDAIPPISPTQWRPPCSPRFCLEP
mmetsp:Transcript_121647/g.339493  ORF Transcript_121647/g.339493 Transcript_121647/m.339493 type:complete len:372 (+) Transcript_121647:2452-3567(+)